MALRAYKEICSRIHRLPLPNTIINRALQLTKYDFQSSAHFSRKRTAKYITLMDDILRDEQYDQIPVLLDVIYKRETPEWLKEFDKIDPLKLKHLWPQKHLIFELAKGKPELMEHTQKYEDHLKRETAFMQVSRDSNKDLQLPPILIPPKQSLQSDYYQSIFNEVQKLYLFIFKNQKKLVQNKVQPMEVLYGTSRFATPIHPHKRDKMLQQTINATKKIFATYKPIDETLLNELIQSAISYPSTINSKYIRYMRRKREIEKTNMSPTVRYYTRSKKLIPTDINIRKILRDYVMRQYYYSDGQYHTSPMTNFYLNKHSMLDSSYLSIYKENQ